MYLRECIENILEKDPAAKSRLEVILCYPGFHVLFFHKFAHALWLKGFRTPARVLSHLGRVVTGIEIHPGATIGRRVFIDHGMGVVIGETAVVGPDCVIYQGVTLGAGSAARQGALTRNVKRHPTLGQGVIVGSGAEIQGDLKIGDNVRVASGSIVLKDVPDNSVVVGVPGRVIYQDGRKIQKEEVPDLEAEAIKALKDKIVALEQNIKELSSTVKCQEKILHTLKSEGLNANQDEASIASSNDQNCLPSSDKKDPVDIFLKGAGI